PELEGALVDAEGAGVGGEGGHAGAEVVAAEGRGHGDPTPPLAASAARGRIDDDAAAEGVTVGVAGLVETTEDQPLPLPDRDRRAPGQVVEGAGPRRDRARGGKLALVAEQGEGVEDADAVGRAGADLEGAPAGPPGAARDGGWTCPR